MPYDYGEREPAGRRLARLAGDLLVGQRKRAARSAVMGWTSGPYINVQAVRRGQRTQYLSDDGQQINHGVRTYLRKYALRAPAMPPGRPAYKLYRGVKMDEQTLAATVRAGRLLDPGYIAFSRDVVAAQRFAHPVLFVLDVRSVPRGTPWIWYGGWDGVRTPKWMASEFPEENEVLLPPGALVIKSVERVNDRLTYVHVSYTGAPAQWSRALGAARVAARVKVRRATR